MQTRRIAIGIGLAASLLTLALQLTRAFQPLEEQMTDLLMRLRGPAPADKRVVICDVDERSIDRYGRFPWPRTRMAELIDRLSADGAQVIALDVIFSEPSPPAEDRALAEAIARSGRVILGYFFRRQPPREKPVFSAQAHPDNIRGSAVEQVIGVFDLIPIPRRPAVEPNLDVFARAADSQGFFSHDRESGVLRHYQLLMSHGGSAYPALALRAVQRFRRLPLILGLKGGVAEITLGDGPINADEAGLLWIDYRGPARTVHTVSVVDVLEGRVRQGTFRDRLIFIGSSETGVGDIHATPFGTEVPGVEVHATVADNLLNGRYIHDGGIQVLISLLALLILGPLVSLLVVVVERHLYGSVLAIVLVLTWPVTCYLNPQGSSPGSAGVAVEV